MKIKNIFIAVLLIQGTINSFAQGNLEANRKQILEEGLLLYRLEKASSHATDILVSKYESLLSDAVGSVSYTEGTDTKTIFWNKKRDIILTVKFEIRPSEGTGVSSSDIRQPSPKEIDLISLKSAALEIMNKNKGKFFSFYEGTKPNLIPIISKKERIIYILTTPEEEMILIGNDYRLRFDEKNELIEKVLFHKSLIELVNPSDRQDIAATFHTHIEKEHPMITPTEICTFLLYKDSFKVKVHKVISKNSTYIFDALNETLIIKAKN